MPKPVKDRPKVTRRRRGTKEPASIVDAIVPVSLEDDGMKATLYGRSGTGKTTLACTWPKPLLLVRAELGTRSVHNVKSVDVTPLLTTPDQVRELIDFQATSGKYATIVLDTASSFQDLVLRTILGLEELPAQLAFGDVHRDQWGQCAMITKEVLRAFLALSCHVLILAQEREFNSDGGSDLLLPSVGPALTPSVSGWLTPQCDYVMQTYIREIKETKMVKVTGKAKPQRRSVTVTRWCGRMGPDPIYITKFRTPKEHHMPDYLVDPSYDKIHALVTGQ